MVKNIIDDISRDEVIEEIYNNTDNSLDYLESLPNEDLELFVYNMNLFGIEFETTEIEIQD